MINLRDVVTFQGLSVDELKRAFAESVDDYLAFCKARGEEPEKPFSGQFVVRAEPSLHKAMAGAAKRAGQMGDGNTGARGDAVMARCTARILPPAVGLCRSF